MQERIDLRPGERVTISGSRADRERLRRVDEDYQEAVVPSHMPLRWGPIIAGLTVALTSMALLALLGTSLGIDAIQSQGQTSDSAATDTARNTAIWGGLITALSFLLGGFVAGRLSGLTDRIGTALHGALVFCSAVPLLVLLAAAGAGALLGGLGDWAGGSGADGAGDAVRAAEIARNGALGALMGSLIALISSWLGGWLAGRENDDR